MRKGVPMKPQVVRRDEETGPQIQPERGSATEGNAVGKSKDGDEKDDGNAMTGESSRSSQRTLSEQIRQVKE